MAARVASRLSCPGVEILHLGEDRVGFVPVQFAHLDGHDPVLRIREHREGERQFHAEFLRRLEPSSSPTSTV